MTTYTYPEMSIYTYADRMHNMHCLEMAQDGCIIYTTKTLLNDEFVEHTRQRIETLNDLKSLSVFTFIKLLATTDLTLKLSKTEHIIIKNLSEIVHVYPGNSGYHVPIFLSEIDQIGLVRAIIFDFTG